MENHSLDSISLNNKKYEQRKGDFKQNEGVELLMKFKYFVPLITFIVPTIIITTLLFWFTEPPPPIQLIGLVILLIAACGTYVMGINERGSAGR